MKGTLKFQEMVSLFVIVFVCVCLCVCVCVCVRAFTVKALSVCLDQFEYQGTDQRCCV